MTVVPIRVRVFRRAGREHYEAQWEDPVTGRKRTKTTGCSKKPDAIRFAALLEQTLQKASNDLEKPSTWDEVVRRYQAEVLAPLRLKTRQKANCAFNKVKSLIDPKSIDRLTASVISQFAAKLRADNPSEFTVKGHLKELQKLLRWCAGLGWLESCPKIQIPKRLASNKGRPITTEEFERMLQQLPKVVKAERVEGWRQMMVGLWWSGLRIDEALQMHWTEPPRSIDTTGKRICLRFTVRGDKAKLSRLLPIAPEFHQMLERVPESERHGYLFAPLTSRGCRPDQVKASKVIAKCGRLANIRTGENTKGETLYASAHDLRRSFGDRWARRRITPAELRELMRHQSLQTTLEFYVGMDAEKTAESAQTAANGARWDDFANIFANSDVRHDVGSEAEAA